MTRGLAAGLALVSLAGLTARASTPNLAPNASFEQEGVVGLLPDGWAFEGIAGLFAHSADEHRTGRRSAAIWAPASTNDQYCPPRTRQCVLNPINLPRDIARTVYSVTPHWRTLDPVEVSNGQIYRLRAHIRMTSATVGEGATIAVRWFDARGFPMSSVVVAERRMRSVDADPTPWLEVEGTVAAPLGAVRAHILLGHTDDLSIGRIAYDDVFFGVA